MIKHLHLLTIALLLCTPASNLVAQIPPLISYQGHVTVNGTNFTGTGQFKFALVNSNASLSFWSNDGTSTSGGQPGSMISIGVTNGLFSTLLGDPALEMPAISPNLFTNPDLRLRIWFNDGHDGFRMLSPDQRLAAVGYAMTASTANTANSANIATTVPDGSINSAKLANSSITASHLAPGAVAANLASSGQSGIVSGGIVMATSANATNLLNAGYQPVGTFSLPESWEQRSNLGAPIARIGHDAVWTGTEMFVWGGAGGAGYLSDGGRYNPVSNTWTPIQSNPSIPARRWFPAIWTGTEIFIWGGYNNGLYVNDGWRENPIPNTWTAIPTTSTLTPRDATTAVWTGTEMIIWGGYADAGGYFGNGARYNPNSNTWTPISDVNAPEPRIFHTGVWTGSQMLIWGGLHGGYINNGARYNPATDTWTPISNVNAPVPRQLHTSVWTGTELIVWGGNGGSTGYLNDGGRYNPVSNIWTPISTVNAPQGRNDHTAVWTGTDMIIWGGNNGGALQSGGVYNPATDTWKPITLTGAPIPRHLHTAVWTGSQMLIWGGESAGYYYNDIYAYTPPKALYLFQKP
jgi:N-acetylneuraminic acid mutarotase